MPYRFWLKRWWLEGAHRWQVVLAFTIVVASSVLGSASNTRLTHELDDAQQRQVDDNAAIIGTLCDELQKDRDSFRALVFAFLDGSSDEDRARATAIIDQYAPEQRTCAEITDPATSTTAPPTTTTP